MNNGAKPKAIRIRELKKCIDDNPFLTDEELARLFSVSIQTIRLDRLELGIPELRERLKKVAEENYDQIRSLSGAELIGEPVDVELNKNGLSILEITPDMVFKKNDIARGHFLFAQANSLAVAVIDAEVALTGYARVAFKRPVKLGEKIVAKATVQSVAGNRFNVSVVSKIDQETVFEGDFSVFAISR
ncbi:MAG: transcription factor FapR [Bacillota bacterium]